MNALFDQQAGNMASGNWWNPSRAINAGLSASSFAPTGISQLLNLGYGGYNGFKGLTSQNNEGFWGQLDPTEPGAFQNAGNWLGSHLASLFGYGSPQMSMAQGQAGNNQNYSSNMGGYYSGGPVNVTPMQSDNALLNRGYAPTGAGNSSGQSFFGSLFSGSSPSSSMQMGQMLDLGSMGDLSQVGK